MLDPYFTKIVRNFVQFPGGGKITGVSEIGLTIGVIAATCSVALFILKSHKFEVAIGPLNFKATK